MTAGGNNALAVIGGDATDFRPNHRLEPPGAERIAPAAQAWRWAHLEGLRQRRAGLRLEELNDQDKTAGAPNHGLEPPGAGRIAPAAQAWR